MIQVFMFVLAGWIVCVSVVFCEYKVIKKLRPTETYAMRESTRRMHSDLNRALVALAFAPLFCTCIPVAFFFTTTISGLNPGPISVAMISQCSWIAVVNPITTTLFVRPYRRAVLGWLSGRAISVSIKPTSTNAVSSQGAGR